jgi:hypothetical protein
MVRRTRLVSLALNVFAALVGICAARSEPLNYQMQITAREFQATSSESQRTSSVVIPCSEGTLCRGRIELFIGGDMRPVAVTGGIARGEAFVMFEAANIPLVIQGQTYGHILMNRSRVGHAAFFAGLPTRAALQDFGSLVRHPVERAPAAFVAKIDIDIRPSN